jgi:hypothetical protein
MTRGPLTVDVGKQFISWGRSDVIHPTDRFSPRDFINVIDSELLPVAGLRTSVQVGAGSVEAVWLPWFTPSRLPLIDQRWTFARPQPPLTFVDGETELPDGPQYGVRWRYTGSRIEAAVSAFQGFNHLPDIAVTPLDPALPVVQGSPGVPPRAPVRVEVSRVHPRIRMFGGDLAIPTPWFILKGEVAYVDSRDRDSDDYTVYVVEIERQAGEWLFDVGYAGEAVAEARAAFTFAPDRQLARSVIGRAQYTLDNGHILTEAAARTDGDGVYVKLEYSRTVGQHWRFTGTAIALRGDEDDFIGQYRRNSHIAAGMRFSF